MNGEGLYPYDSIEWNRFSFDTIESTITFDFNNERTLRITPDIRGSIRGGENGAYCVHPFDRERR